MAQEEDPLDPVWCVVDSEDESQGDSFGEECPLSATGCKQRHHGGTGHIKWENDYHGNLQHVAKGTWVNGCGGTKPGAPDDDWFDDRAFGTWQSSRGANIGDWHIDELSPTNSPCYYKPASGTKQEFARGFVRPGKDKVDFKCRGADHTSTLFTVYHGGLQLRNSEAVLLGYLEEETNDLG